MQTETVVKLSPSFLPTINLTGDITQAIREGGLKLRTGQWVSHPAGLKGQFLAVRNGQIFVAWNDRQEEDFTGRTQRFARAVWHHKRKYDPVTAITQAPRSLSFDMVKDWFRTRFTRRATA